MKRGAVTRIARLLLAAMLGIVALAYVFFPAERSTTPLDRAPINLIVPDYFDPIYFQGQGFPVAREFVTDGTHQSGELTLHVIPGFASRVAYKSTQETESQVAVVNARFAPTPPWRFRPERRMGHYKCMATATSMVADWFALQRGEPLEEYESILDGRRYLGHDPRPIDAAYYERATRDVEHFPLSGPDHADPVSGVPVPYSIAGFAQLLSEATTQPPRVVADPHLPLHHSFDLHRAGSLELVPVLQPGLQWRALVRAYPRAASERIRSALEHHGPLLAGIKVRFSALHGLFRDTRLGDFPIVGPSGHGVVIVGWIERDRKLYFLYRETFGNCDEERVDCGPAYRVYPVYGFNEVYAFRRP